MNPIDLLRSGIKKGSWESVVEGFRLLSGEELPAPPANGVMFEEIVDAIADVFGLTNRPPPEPEEPPAPRKKGRPRKKAAAKKGGVDTTDPLVLESIEQSKRAQPKNYRGQFSMIEDTCSECGKKFKTHPTLKSRAMDGKDKKSSVYCAQCTPRGSR